MPTDLTEPPAAEPWSAEVVLPVLLAAGRMTYGKAIRDNLLAAAPVLAVVWKYSCRQFSAVVSVVECQIAFDSAGGPSSPYRTVKDLLADPQLAHRGAWAEVADQGGSFKVVNPPFRFSAAPIQVANFAATLGQHTREVLESAGYAAEEIEKMSSAGIVVLE